jgi:hypothetical protein
MSPEPNSPIEAAYRRHSVDVVAERMTTPIAVNTPVAPSADNGSSSIRRAARPGRLAVAGFISAQLRDASESITPLQ